MNLCNFSSTLHVLLNVNCLTIQKTIEMKTLQVFPLSHEAIQRGCPAFCQNLHPLHIHLVNEKGKENFLFHVLMNNSGNGLQEFNFESNGNKHLKNNYRLYKSNKGNLGKYAFLLINLNNIRLASISSKDRVSQTNDSQMLLRIRNLWKACYNEDCSTPFLIQLVCCRAQEFTFLTGSQKMLKTMI